MDENLNQDEKLNELNKREDALTYEMNEYDSQKNNYIFEMSAINQKIEELQQQLNDYQKQRDSLSQKMNESESNRIHDIVELNKVKEEITEIEEENKPHVDSATLEYSNLLSKYNKELEEYNKSISKLYELQKQYEEGNIEYSKYEEFALPLAKQYSSLKKDYETLNKLYEKLNKSNSSLENLTDEQLNEKLSNLNNEINEEWNYGAHNLNGSESVDNSNLNKLISERDAIKVEKDKRVVSTLSDKDLENNINKLTTFSKSFETEENQNKYNKERNLVNLELKIHNDELAKRKSRPFISLTDEQLDKKLDELNEEYIDEWNYSAHQENGMEPNDSSKLDTIQQQINSIKAEKAERSNNVTKTLEKPVAPEIAIFIKEIPIDKAETKNTNGINNLTAEISDNETVIDHTTPYEDKPHIKEDDVKKAQDEYYKQNNNKPEKQSIFKSMISKVKSIYSKIKGTKVLPAGLKDKDYDDSDMKIYEEKKNRFTSELQNYTPNNKTSDKESINKRENIDESRYR